MRSALKVVALGVLVLATVCTGHSQAASTTSDAASGSLVGIVQDAEGGLLPGARIEVLSATGKAAVAFADEDGAFRVDGIAPGTYTIRITAEGFLLQTGSGKLQAGEEQTLQTISLRPASTSASVTVNATEHEVAAAQVAQAEKQRVLGVIPNFYVVYDAHPAPLSRGQKFHLAWRSSLDPVSFLGAGLAAGVEQGSDEFKGYGQGASGYGKRYGAAFADGAVSTFLGGAILPSIFHQDPRYRYQGTGSVASRLRHAALSVLVCRGDNDKAEFNYSNVVGNFASAGISNLYYPASDRHGAGLTLQNAAIGTAFGVFGSVMQEFVVPKLTPHLGGRARR